MEIYKDIPGYENIYQAALDKHLKENI